MDNRTHSVGDMRFPPIWHKNSAKISPKANIFMFYNLLPLICFWVKELGVLTAEIFLCLWGNTFDRNSSPSQFWLFLNHISGVSFLLICHCHNSSISPWHVNSPLHDRSELCPPSLVAILVRTGKDWEQRIQGLPWAESGKTTDLEVSDPNSLDSLLKVVFVY